MITSASLLRRSTGLLLLLLCCAASSACKDNTPLGDSAPVADIPLATLDHQGSMDVPGSADRANPDKQTTENGTYLAACVFYTTLTGLSPIGIADKPAGLSAADAKALQSAAYYTVKPK